MQEGAQTTDQSLDERICLMREAILEAADDIYLMTRKRSGTESLSSECPLGDASSTTSSTTSTSTTASSSSTTSAVISQ